MEKNLNNFPKLTRREILKILKSRKLEDLDRIRQAEGFLQKKRGYVFRLPKQGTPVIVLFSGGMDSFVTSGILMKEFGLSIYPLLLKRGHVYDRYEEQAADYLSDYYLSVFPKLFHPLEKIEARFPIQPFKKRKEMRKNFFYSTLIAIYTAQYVYRLQVRKGLKLRDIFFGYVRGDGEMREDQTLTALRDIMLTLCMRTGDFTWQVTSLMIEKEIGFFYDKDFLVKWGHKNEIPLGKTRSSCHQKSGFQCGECLFCSVRKKAFKKANVPDRTVYRRKRPFRKKVLEKSKKLLGGR